VTRYWNKDLRLLHRYFDEEGAQARWPFCSADGTGVAPSAPGFTADDSNTGSHAFGNVATIIQDFLEQVQIVDALLHYLLLKSCLILVVCRNLFWCYLMVLSKA
jgi:hypothetical protein